MRPLERSAPSENDVEALEEAYQSTRDRRRHTRIQKVFLAVEQHPADSLAEQTGSRTSDETVRQVLKAGAIVLSRHQQKVSSPDPEEERKTDDRRGA